MQYPTARQIRHHQVGEGMFALHLKMAHLNYQPDFSVEFWAMSALIQDAAKNINSDLEAMTTEGLRAAFSAYQGAVLHHLNTCEGHARSSTD